MTEDKGILIKNIYYMLSYAFKILKNSNYANIAAENFHNVYDLFAAILHRGIAQQLKHGLYREYINRKDSLATMRGKLDIRGSIAKKLQRKQLLVCEFDELSVNNIFNQIIKTTAMALLKEKSVSPEHKASLKKDMRYFGEIDCVDKAAIHWDSLRIQKNNQNYRLLMNICYFVLNSLLQTTESGKYKLENFLEDRMANLYENFVLEYYRYHYGDRICEIKPAYIDWILDNANEASPWFLPKMKTDITLITDNRVLIIDTKYYGKMMQTYFNTSKIHSNNLYQIFAYVKNYAVQEKKVIEGMLLYAKTDEAVAPDYTYSMSGNKISIKALDLNKDFSEIAKQLNAIVESAFNIRKRG